MSLGSRRISRSITTPIAGRTPLLSASHDSQERHASLIIVQVIACAADTWFGGYTIFLTIIMLNVFAAGSSNYVTYLTESHVCILLFRYVCWISSKEQLVVTRADRVSRRGKNVLVRLFMFGHAV